MKYKVVFIDWDGTLSDSRFWSHLPRTQIKALQCELFAYKELTDSWMRSQMSSEEICKKVSKEIGLEPEYLLAQLEQSCKNMTFIEEDINNSIAELRSAGTTVVIATNNMDTFTRWTVPHMGLNDLFDDVLDSFTLGFLKHEKDDTGNHPFFGNYLKTNSMLPEETILLDNNINNAVVRDIGMDFALVTKDRPVSQILKSVY